MKKEDTHYEKHNKKFLQTVEGPTTTLEDTKIDVLNIETTTVNLDDR